MSKGNDGAFPSAPQQNHEETLAVGGLTKRELFAAMAMQGILSRDLTANPYTTGRLAEQAHVADRNRHDVARQALESADALLAELAKGESDE